jgi:hypothetical protein
MSARGYPDSITISGFKQGVAYTVERAPAAASGATTGAYTAAALSKYAYLTPDPARRVLYIPHQSGKGRRTPPV